MAAEWLTQQAWLMVVGLSGYLLVLSIDLVGGERRLERREALALGAGILALVATALLTSLPRPMLFPFNFLISLALGAAMQFGTLNLLDPGTPAELSEAQTLAEYRALLGEMKELAAGTAAASRCACVPNATAGQLTEIASIVGCLASRYEERSPNLAGASATLTILQQFDKVLACYLKMKSGEQFVDEDAKGREIAETEGRTIPMVNGALANLGRQLDAGEVLDKTITEGALESMLRSLNLIKGLNDRPKAAHDLDEGP
jgi:hypothetical protein